MTRQQITTTTTSSAAATAVVIVEHNAQAVQELQELAGVGVEKEDDRNEEQERKTSGTGTCKSYIRVRGGCVRTATTTKTIYEHQDQKVVYGHPTALKHRMNQKPETPRIQRKAHTHKHPGIRDNSADLNLT